MSDAKSNLSLPVLRKHQRVSKRRTKHTTMDLQESSWNFVQFQWVRMSRPGTHTTICQPGSRTSRDHGTRSRFLCWFFCLRGRPRTSLEGHLHHCCTDLNIWLWKTCWNLLYTSRAARGGGGSFKNRKPIGEIRCCESQLSDQKHWLIVQLSNSLTD